MRRTLAFVLILLFLLTGCGQQTPASAPQSAEPIAAATADPTPEPTREPLPEAPYVDARKPYTYIWENERDRKWEEDIVYFAETYLDPYHGHARITDRIQTMWVYNSTALRLPSSDSGYFFDPALKETFIGKMNEIILSIPDRTDEEIVLGLWEATALLSDLHGIVGMTVKMESEMLPIRVALIWTEDGLSGVIDACPAEYADELLGKRLIAINGFTLAEIRERLQPCVSFEVEPALDAMIVGFHNSLLPICELLRYIGVMDRENSALLTVRAYTGEESVVEIKSCGYSDFMNDTACFQAGKAGSDMSFRLMESDKSCTAWYRLLADGETLYFRINQCDADETFGTLLDEAFTAAESAGMLLKVIVDLRGNPGGYPDLEGNYLKLVDKLNESGADVCALIDGESFSGSIALSSTLRRRVEKVRIVGTPGGQPVRFFYGRQYYLPNSGVRFKCSTIYADFWPGYGEGPLLPDITVYQSWEDYLEGYDSVLKYVLDQ